MARKRRTTLLLLVGLGALGAALALRSRKAVAAAPPGKPDVVKPKKPGPPAPVEDPTPPEGHREIFENYKAVVDGCFARGVGLDQQNIDLAIRELRLCAMDEMFPDHVWPPAPTAHQWQRNLWNDMDFRAYVQRKFQTPDVPGP